MRAPLKQRDCWELWFCVLCLGQLRHVYDQILRAELGSYQEGHCCLTTAAILDRKGGSC